MMDLGSRGGGVGDDCDKLMIIVIDKYNGMKEIL